MKATTSGLLLTAAGTFGMGLYKMFVYDSGGLYSDPVNAAVGGDAYNLIINSTQSTAWMVLAGALLVSSFLSEIMYTLKENKTPATAKEIEPSLPNATEKKRVDSQQHVEGEGFAAWIKKELL